MQLNVVFIVSPADNGNYDVSAHVVNSPLSSQEITREYAEQLTEECVTVLVGYLLERYPEAVALAWPQSPGMCRPCNN